MVIKVKSCIECPLHYYNDEYMTGFCPLNHDNTLYEALGMRDIEESKCILSTEEVLIKKLKS